MLDDVTEVDIGNMDYPTLSALRQRIEEKVREMREVGGPALRDCLTKKFSGHPYAGRASGTFGVSRWPGRKRRPKGRSARRRIVKLRDRAPSGGKPGGALLMWGRK
jgi:hypothetical protein